MADFNPVVGGEECPINKVLSKLTTSKVLGLLDNKWSDFARDLEAPFDQIQKLRSDLKLDKLTLTGVIAELIEGWVGRKGQQASLLELIRILEDNELKIWADHVGQDLNLPWQGQVSWNVLSPVHQHKVKDQLSNIFPNIHFEEQTLHNLEGNVLRELMLGLKPVLFEKMKPEKLSYYVSRTLITGNFIADKIFDEEFDEKVSDVFVFSGLELDELSDLAPAKLVTSSTKVLGTAIAEINNFMILDEPYHFDKIHRQTELSMHLINKEDDGRLRWERSKGKLDEIQKFVAPSQQDLSEEEFMTMLMNSDSSWPIIISDSPGMGKSALLKETTNRLSEMYPDRLVLFLFATEFVNLVKKFCKTVTKESVINALKNLACENSLEATILESKLGSDEGTSVELLLDGFDELNCRDHNFAKQILEITINSLKSVRIWVTTRQHLLKELERTLNTFGIAIKPFNEDDQVRFLTSYWSKERNFNEDEIAKLKEFSLQCLQMIKTSMTTKDRDIAGLPLQCRLIAEAYDEDIINYARSNKNSLPKQAISIIKLYQGLVKKRHASYLKIHESEKEKAIMKMQSGIGFKLVFKEHFTNLKGLFGNIDMAKILKVGIVEYTNTERTERFIHQTFAEYFVAWFLLDRLRREEGLLKWLLDEDTVPALIFELVLECKKTRVQVGLNHTEINSYKFWRPQATYFFNWLMAELFFKPSVKTIKTKPKQFKTVQLQRIKKAFDSEAAIRRITHACANADFIYIPKLFEEMQIFDEYKKTIFNQEFLFLVIQTSGLEFLKQTMAHFESNYEFDLNLQIEALRLVARRGEHGIVEYFLKQKKLNEIVIELFDEIKLLIHDCVRNTKHNSDAEITQRIQVIRMFLRKNPLLLEQRDEDGKTPILSENVHIRLMEELIVKFNVDLFARDNQNQTVLQVRNDLSDSDYTQLIEMIPKETSEILMMEKTNASMGVSSMRLLTSDPLPTPTDLFEDKVASFYNVKGDEEYSALETAIKTSKNVETLKKLIELGASVERKHNNNETLLHLAAKWGNVEAIRFLVMEHGFNLNVEDNDGLTALDYAIRNNEYKTALELHQLEGTFKDVVNSDGQTWLHVTSLEGHFKSVRLLSTIIVVDINRADHEGNTALHLGVASFNVTYLLLENGADPQMFNKSGEIPFHSGLQRGQLNLRTFKLLKSKTNIEASPELAVLAMEFVMRNETEFSKDEYNIMIDELVAVIGTKEKMPPKPDDSMNNGSNNNEDVSKTTYDSKGFEDLECCKDNDDDDEHMNYVVIVTPIDFDQEAMSTVQLPPMYKGHFRINK